MIKKLFTFVVCLILTGCATPQKKAENSAQPIEQPELPAAKKESVVDFALLPFQVMAKGVADGGRVILGMLQVPVIIVLFPFQLLHDLHEAEHVVEKSIRPFPKPVVQ